MEVTEELRWKIKNSFDDDEEQKKTKREALAEGYLQSWARNVDAQIEGPFVGGEAIGVADLKLFIATRLIADGVVDNLPTDAFDQHPKLSALRKAVAEHPTVVEWYERRAAAKG